MKTVEHGRRGCGEIHGSSYATARAKLQVAGPYNCRDLGRYPRVLYFAGDGCVLNPQNVTILVSINDMARGRCRFTHCFQQTGPADSMRMRLMLLGGGNALGQALIRLGAEEDIGFLAPRPPESGWDAASLTASSAVRRVWAGLDSAQQAKDSASRHRPLQRYRDNTE